jgi:Phage integrase, N-terminal SAM-like domain
MVATSSLVRYEDPLDVRERDAIGGFLAGYAGNSRASYTTDLRRFAWCVDNRLRMLDVRRAHLEMFARTMEQQGRMRSTVARRSSTRCSFYRYCHLEGLLARDPAPTSAAPRSTPSPGRWAWTATSSAPSSSRPASARGALTPSSACWP